MRQLGMLSVVAVLVAGCAVRLGGPKPIEYRAIALQTGPESSPAEVARWIRQADANLVLLEAPGDSAWFDEVARQVKLTLSGPGVAGSVAFGFLAGEAVGDTTIVLPLEGGGEVALHDALYIVGAGRYLDLLAARFSPDADVREAVRALLNYIATDVMPQAAVVLAVNAPDPAAAEQVSMLLRPVFSDASNCRSRGRGSANASGNGLEQSRMRLYYGPDTLLRCSSARPLGAGGPLVARLVLGR